MSESLMLRPIFATNRAIGIALFAMLIGIGSWISSLAWLHMAWRKLVAVARVEHVSIGTAPEAINGFAANFPLFVATVLGIMGVLLTRRWFIEKHARQELAKHISAGGDAITERVLLKNVELRNCGTRRLTRAFLCSCAVSIVGNSVLVAFILWTVRRYYS